jgi:hypothetical protein
MKWLPLKMNYLPLIFQEINFVTEEYIRLLSKIREKEKGESKKNNDKKENKNENEKENKTDRDDDNEEDLEIIIKKYNGLRESISKRINELEDFYEDNIEDVRVSNFEKARLRLKKLLMYSYDTINRIENSSQQKNIFIKENNNIFNKKITEDTKKKIMENNITLEKQMIKEKNKEDEKVKKRLGEKEKVQKPKKKKVFKNYLPNQKQILKVTGDEGFMKPTERGKRASMARFVKDSENTGGFDYDDYSKCREIIFKIKLNPDEFKLLQKEKKNKGKVSPYLFK